MPNIPETWRSKKERYNLLGLYDVASGQVIMRPNGKQKEQSAHIVATLEELDIPATPFVLQVLHLAHEVLSTSPSEERIEGLLQYFLESEGPVQPEEVAAFLHMTEYLSQQAVTVPEQRQSVDSPVSTAVPVPVF